LHATQLGAMGGSRPIGAFSTGVRVDWGLSYTTIIITNSASIRHTQDDKKGFSLKMKGKVWTG